MPAPKVTPDGWVVSDWDSFYFFTAHEPPRSNVVWKQLWADVRGWKTLAMWGAGVGLIAAAVITEWWPLIVPGVMVLLVYFKMFWGVVRHHRDTPVLTGVIEDDLRPHPLPMFGYPSTTVATTPDGREVPVAITEHVAELFKQAKTVEVVFLYDPGSQYNLVFGARARA